MLIAPTVLPANRLLNSFSRMLQEPDLLGEEGLTVRLKTFQCELEIGKSSPITGPRCPEGSKIT